jgi:hypothetical protein
MYGLLNEPIYNRQNAQLSHSAGWFRDFHAPHRLRLVRSIQQVFFDLYPVLLQVRLQLLDQHSINAGRPFVAHHPRVSIKQVPTCDHCFHQLQFFRSDGLFPCRSA